MKAIMVRPGSAGASLGSLELFRNGGVLVKTLYTGICGTDREIVSGRLSLARPEAGELLVLGHEAIGSVVDPGDSQFSKGDLVVPMVRRPGGCRNCMRGRQDYCLDGNFTEAGIRGKNGFMAEQFYERRDFLVKVDGGAGISGVLTEPTKNVMKIKEAVMGVEGRSLWDEGLDNKCAWIFGTGTEGFLIGSVFKSLGMDIMMVNRHPLSEKQESILDAIGGSFFDSSADDWKSAAKDMPMDLAVDAAGAPSVLMQAIDNINHDGIIVLFGTGGSGYEGKLSGNTVIKIVDKNLTIIGCEDGSKEHYEQAADFLAANSSRFKLDSLITGEYAPEDTNVLSEKQPGEIKSVIKW